jgi:magnesium chelatase family protein
MLATTHASTIIGLDTHPVQVEVDITRGMPAFDLVGLAEAAVRESRTRVRAAMEQSGYPLPDPSGDGEPRARRRAQGRDGLRPRHRHRHPRRGGRVRRRLASTRWLLLGELSLTGGVRGVRGVLPQVMAARDRGVRGAIVATENARRGRGGRGHRGARGRLPAGGVRVPRRAAVSCAGAAAGARRRARASHPGLDLRDVRGQEHAKRAFEVAAAGGHNVMLTGPPGAGKTLLSRALPGLLPPLSLRESMEVTAVHSVAGMLRQGVALMRERPYRAPHHTASAVGLVGGGDPPRPGEIALAHHGVLFLDELPEFPRESLEALREPLEEGHVTIVRARSRASYPARFTLVAAMNPCPCGWHGDPSDRCECSEERVKRYRARVSGPLLDRIDLYVALPPAEGADLDALPTGSGPSAEVRARVAAARAAQRARSGDINARLTVRTMPAVTVLDAAGQRLLRSAAERMGLSARAIHRVLKVGRTIADLEGARR